MYYALSLRDILRTTKLNFEFFDNLDEFHLLCVQNWFNQILEDQMGMMTEVESYNYNLFEQFLDHKEQLDFFDDLKKAS